jgi:hypothetical protein
MGPSSAGRISRGNVVAGLIVVLTLMMLAGAVVAFVPMVRCPEIHFMSWSEKPSDCPRCGRSYRIPLLNKWYWRPTPRRLPR